MSFVLFDTIARRNSIATNYNSMNDHVDIREDVAVCDVIESLAISAAPESTGVTTFVQEACTAISAVDSKYSTTFYPVQTDIQDVREYFRRPVCIGAGTIPNSRGRFFNLQPTFNSLITFWSNGVNRLIGAYGIRAKVVLTLQVAATPFHQGLVCVSGQYGCQALTQIYDRASNSNTATNLPNVVLDLSNDTSVQFHFPFLFPTEYCSIRSSLQEPKYCYFSLNNLTFVPSIAGMGSPTYQLYMHFEDIELFGATPQSTSTVVLTAGRKLSPVTEEFENDAFPFSSALHSVGKAVSFVAKGVPSLSSIGGPVAWALGKAAGVVRYFGYGKPAVVDPVMRVFRMDNVGEFNTDVATASMVMAATAANTTSINTSVGSSDVDEMALKYVTSRWAQINYFDLATTAAVSTLVYATPINMLAFWFRSTGAVPAANKLVSNISTASSNSISPSHLMFAATSFKQWRGGIKFRFTFAKTKMHAGRVMVAYNPYLSTVTNTTAMVAATSVDLPVYGTIGADPFGYSAIFDLKDGNVFEFEIPYVSPAPYSNLATSNGALAMYVVNPLIASSVVSTSIGCIVEVCGMSDFELANPAGCMFSVHNAGTIRLNAGRVLSEAPEVLNQLTMGEVITSVKQLISIPHNASDDLTAPLSIYVAPWYYQPTPSVLTPPVGLPPLLSFSYGGNWASCYAFLKGGTDFHAYSPDNTVLLTLTQAPFSGGYDPNTATPDNRSNANVPSLISSRGTVHARLPGFFPTARVFSWVANVLTATGSTWVPNVFASTSPVAPWYGPQAVYAFSSNVSNTSPIYYNRCASDDAQLAHYIGPPPFFLPAASTAGNYDSNGTPLVLA